jgi:CheY-like chemotaxis protein
MNIVNKHLFLRDMQEIHDRLDRWQEVVNQIAESYGGAASLICQLTDTGIRPVASSDQNSNPFPVGATFPMEAHTFCKRVISTGEQVYVSNAAEDAGWSPSPVWAEYGFCSYYGLPVKWPDGEIFGTICVMDKAATNYQRPFLAWMSCFRDLIEADLTMTTQNLDHSRYLADVGQDLKNSATTIVERTKSLMSSTLSDKQRLELDSIQDCAETLICLLNEGLEDTGATSSVKTAPMESPRVLVVDDNRINQKVAGALLQSLKFTCEFANDGVEALDAVQASQFDVILMDIQMPRMDGLEATRQIRALGGRYASIPIVAVTANAMLNDKIKCLDAGMNDLLAKPIEPVQFSEMLLTYTTMPAQ